MLFRYVLVARATVPRSLGFVGPHGNKAGAYALMRARASSSSSSSQFRGLAAVAGTTTRATAFPEDYEVPEVWAYDDDVKATAGSNDPTAGPRKTAELPRGSHAVQLYSLGTPNGIKASILLEELNELKGVEYDAWKIDFSALDQFSTGFVDVNPNSKIPALLDYDHDEGPVRVFESGSILLYLANKYDAFLPADDDAKARVQAINWLFWQVGGAPSMGALGHFKNVAPVKLKYAVDRFALETKRQLSVLDQHLAVPGNEYVAGAEYSIADVAIWPWIRTLETSYKASDFLDLPSYPHVRAWFDKIAQRPAVVRGVRVLGFGPDALTERHSRADFE